MTQYIQFTYPLHIHKNKPPIEGNYHKYPFHKFNAPFTLWPHNKMLNTKHFVCGIWGMSPAS